MTHLRFRGFLSAMVTHVSLFSRDVHNVRPGRYACHVCQSAHFSSSGAPCGGRFKKCVGTGKGGSCRDKCCVRVRPRNYVLTKKDLYLPSGVLGTLHRSVCSGVSRCHSVIRSPRFRRFFPVMNRSFLGATPGKFPGSFGCVSCLGPGRFAYTCSIPSDFFLAPSVLSGVRRIFQRFGHFTSFAGFAVSSFRWWSNECFLDSCGGLVLGRGGASFL